MKYLFNSVLAFYAFPEGGEGKSQNNRHLTLKMLRWRFCIAVICILFIDVSKPAEIEDQCQ